MPKRLNIAIDATWIANDNFDGKIKSGALRVTMNLLNQLINHPEHNFFLINTSFHPRNFEKLKAYRDEYLNYDHIEVAAVKLNFLNSKIIYKIYLSLNKFISISYFFSFIPKKVQKNLDIFHSPVDPIPRIIRKNKRIKKFLTALDLIPLVKPEYSQQFSEYTQRIYDSADNESIFLAISKCTKNDILKIKKDFNPNKIFITYLGADKSIFHKIESNNKLILKLKKFGLKKHGYFLTINAFAKYKNFEFIIKNFIAFCKANPNINKKLVVLGYAREDDYKTNLIEEYDIQDKIIFLEDLLDTDLAVIYNGAICFLYMSLYEGFGLPVLEAMQCGTPVICSNTSSIPEVSGDAALLCSPKDSKLFIEHLKNIVTDSNLRLRVAEKGLFQSSKFSWKIYGDSVVYAYENKDIFS